VTLVRSGPTIGVAVQVTVLVLLATTVGLGAAAWLAGITYGVVVCLALSHGLRRWAAAGLGPADRVTLARAILVGGVTALAVESTQRNVPVTVLVALACVALVLDGVDGQVARRTGTASPLGARFDMEVDAFLLLVLSFFVAPMFGGWVIAIGAMRYAFVAASWVLPWMRATLPPRYWRKVAAATQGIVLVVAASGVLPGPLAALAVAASLAMLVESFGRDVLWLWHRRTVTVGRPVLAVRYGSSAPGRLSSIGSKS
jgi:phosphatidylglycerophosphate synthase